MLNLNPWIDFDEIVFIRIRIHQELDRARIVVPDRASNPHRRFAQRFTNRAREVGCRGDFDDFLMATLHGAVAFVKVDQIPVLVTE